MAESVRPMESLHQAASQKNLCFFSLLIFLQKSSPESHATLGELSES